MKACSNTLVFHQSSATAFRLAPIPRSLPSWSTDDELRLQPSAPSPLSHRGRRHCRRCCDVHPQSKPVLRSSLWHYRCQLWLLALWQPSTRHQGPPPPPTHGGTWYEPAGSGLSRRRRNQRVTHNTGVWCNKLRVAKRRTDDIRLDVECTFSASVHLHTHTHTNMTNETQQMSNSHRLYITAKHPCPPFNICIVYLVPHACPLHLPLYIHISEFVLILFLLQVCIQYKKQET